jgi:hypothetical protein
LPKAGKVIRVQDQVFNRVTCPTHFLSEGWLKKDEGTWSNQIQAADHFRRLEPKVEGGVNDTEPKAGILQKDVMVQQW